MNTIDAIGAAAAWLPYAERHWRHHPDREDAGFFGTGTVAIQSLEAVAEHAYVCAALARRLDGLPPGELLSHRLVERALAGLR